MFLFTDTSSEIGYGAYWQRHWLQQTWPRSLQHHSIQWKELYAIVMACEVWGHLWSQRRVLYHCDKLTVVHVWHVQGSTIDAPSTGIILRSCEAELSCVHYPHRRCRNSISDALSRFQMQKFPQLAPDADDEPTPTPTQLTLHSWL